MSVFDSAEFAELYEIIYESNKYPSEESKVEYERRREEFLNYCQQQSELEPLDIDMGYFESDEINHIVIVSG